MDTRRPTGRTARDGAPTRPRSPTFPVLLILAAALVLALGVLAGATRYAQILTPEVDRRIEAGAEPAPRASDDRRAGVAMPGTDPTEPAPFRYFPRSVAGGD